MRAWSRSIFPRPYIWRFTSLSLVIWSSVWPLDQARGDRRLNGGIIFHDTVGERGDQAGTGAFEPGIQLCQRSSSDHTSEGGDDLAGVHKKRDAGPVKGVSLSFPRQGWGMLMGTKGDFFHERPATSRQDQGTAEQAGRGADGAAGRTRRHGGALGPASQAVEGDDACRFRARVAVHGRARRTRRQGERRGARPHRPGVGYERGAFTTPRLPIGPEKAAEQIVAPTAISSRLPWRR
jgi:hypothetical protein